MRTAEGPFPSSTPARPGDCRRPAALNPKAWHLLAIFLSTITGIITGPLPLGAVASPLPSYPPGGGGDPSRRPREKGAPDQGESSPTLIFNEPLRTRLGAALLALGVSILTGTLPRARPSDPLPPPLRRIHFPVVAYRNPPFLDGSDSKTDPPPRTPSCTRSFLFAASIHSTGGGLTRVRARLV